MKKTLVTFALYISSICFTKNLLPLPDEWKCNADMQAYICSEPLKGTILLVLIQDASSWDTLENYRTYLNQTKTIQDNNGKNITARILSVVEETWQSTKWVRATHENSEIPGFYAEYEATVTEIGGKKRAVLITMVSENFRIDVV